MVCPTDSTHRTRMCGHYDAVWCEPCDRWIEPVCSDPTCGYCADRPLTPDGCECCSRFLPDTPTDQ